MFSTSEQYYDELYGAMGKDYAKETNKVHKFIQKHKRTDGNALLDVACGTGTHAGLLSKFYKVAGLDLDRKMLAIAHKKYPKIKLHQGDMADFDLQKQFDAIVCLFSSIGYAKTRSKLRKAIQTMSRHLLPGGVLLVEPWFSEEQWKVGRASMLEVNKPELKLVRISHTGQRGKISLLEFQYLVGTPKGITHSREMHEMGLFTHAEYMDAFLATGLKTIHDKKGLDGRGLYIGKKPLK
jgi:ubiquinone/menaquinone biosynthesis C-methylase UbiE